MKKLYILFISIISIIQIYGQTISGRIVDDLDRPIRDVRVYIDGTSVTTLSNDQGNFNLEIGKLNNGTVIFKKQDYETFSTPIFNILNKKLKVIINKITVIDEVVMTPYTEEAYKNYIHYFLTQFIGRDQKNVTIKNLRTLKFSYNKSNKLLKVKAPKTLIIENKNLGYEVNFDLISFEADFKNNIVSYYGTSYFKVISDKKEVKKNRINAFLGSTQHFLRSIYHDELQQKGFRVNYIEKQPNPLYPTDEELQKVDDYMKLIKGQKEITIPAEISKILERKRKQSKTVMAVIKQNVSINDYITLNNGIKTIQVKDILQVIYPKQIYKLSKGKIIPSEENITEDTFIYFEGKSFDIYEDGNISEPENFMVNGAFSTNTIEKMLPSNYNIGD